MNDYEIINIDRFYNNKGLANDLDYINASLSLVGSSLPKDEIPLNKLFYINNYPYLISENDLGDNIVLEGQELNLQKNYYASAISFIGCSVYGDYYDYIHLYDNETLVKSIKIALTDCNSVSAQFGNEQVFKLPYFYNKNSEGRKYNSTPIIWSHTINFNETIKFNKMIVEDNPCIHIFSITVRNEGKNEWIIL